MLAGYGLGETYTVSSNTSTEIVMTTAFIPVDKLVMDPGAVNIPRGLCWLGVQKPSETSQWVTSTLPIGNNVSLVTGNTPTPAGPEGGKIILTLTNGSSSNAAMIYQLGSASGSPVTSETFPGSIIKRSNAYWGYHTWESPSGSFEIDFSGIAGSASTTKLLRRTREGTWEDYTSGASLDYNTKKYTVSSLANGDYEFALGDAAYSPLPYTQNFDWEWFDNSNTRNTPDNYWLNNSPATGNNSWRREKDGSSAAWAYSTAGVVRPYSSHSADFHSYDADLGTTGTLDLKVDFSTSGNKVMTFYYANASGTDKLEIFLSIDGGANFSSVLGTYNTGAWAKKTLSLGTSTSSTCIVRFKATSDYGYNDIGIDNVYISVRGLYTIDAGTYSVDVNPNLNAGAFYPKATVKNFSTASKTFPVTMRITDSSNSSQVYLSTKTVTGLGADATTQVTFNDQWTAAAGRYTVTVCTGLSGDEDASNDCLTKTVGVSDGLWEYKLVYPVTTLLGSGVGYKVSGVDYFFSIGGHTSSSPEGRACYKYNVTANTWHLLTSLPEARMVLATAIIDNYLYAIGGSNASNAYQSTVYQYNISGNSWLTLNPGGTALPSLGWCKAVAYGNYIFLAGGYNGTNALSSVYVYDVSANTWSPATSMPGARFGGAFSVTGTTLVYIGGAQDNSTLTNTVYRGTIGTPVTSISWTSSLNPYPGNGKEVYLSSSYNLSDLDFPRKQNSENKNGNDPQSDKSTFPPGSMYGFDAAPWGSDGIIVAGGTPYGDFNPADPNPCYVYKPLTDTWILKQYVPTPVAGSSLGSVFDGTNWKLIVTSGLVLNAFTNLNQVFTDATPGDNIILSMTSLLEGYYSEGSKNQKETPVTVELRESVYPYTLADSKTILQNNLGFCTAEFSNAQSSNLYYIIVKYPNGLETWSASPQRFTGNLLIYDFTSASSQAYGNNMIKVGTKWCIFSGDIDGNASINAVDRGYCWNDRTLTGEQISDLNGDGIVNELDRAILSNNKNISAKYPGGFIPASGKVRKTETISSDKLMKSYK